MLGRVRQRVHGGLGTDIAGGDGGFHAYDGVLVVGGFAQASVAILEMRMPVT